VPKKVHCPSLSLCHIAGVNLFRTRWANLDVSSSLFIRFIVVSVRVYLPHVRTKGISPSRGFNEFTAANVPGFPPQNPKNPNVSQVTISLCSKSPASRGAMLRRVVRAFFVTDVHFQSCIATPHVRPMTSKMYTWNTTHKLINAC
jgi:hypothetical protein